MARRRPPPRGRLPAGRRPGRGRDEGDEEDVPPPAPVWERLILSRGFRVVVMTTFGSAAIAVMVFLIGPANISRGAGVAGAFVGTQSLKTGKQASVAVAASITEEGRRLWVETATPAPTATPSPTPQPTWTPLPTPAPPRRLPPTPVPTPAPGQALPPQQPGAAAPQLPFDDAVHSQREYFEVLALGDVRRALQYWSPEAAPEARSALDAAVARGDTYVIKEIIPRPIPQISGMEITVDLDVVDSTGRITASQQVYLWRFIDSQWYITTRLQ